MTTSAARLAQVEVVDADSRGVRFVDVQQWPLRIGRALDNDLVLPDPWVAPYHATIEPDAEGRLQIRIGDSRNGARIEHGREVKLVRANESTALPSLAHWHLGHSQLLLRLPHDPLPAELLLTQTASPAPRWLLPVLLLAALVWMLVSRWITSESDTKWHEHAGALLGEGALLFGWGVLWALVSKLFTGRFTILPHIRLALVFGLIMLAVDLLLTVLAFSLDLPLLSHLRSAAGLAVGAVWITQHLRLVQPRRARLLAAAVAVCAGLGLAVAMVATWYRYDRWLDELYAANLLPPSWRVARAQPVATLLDDLRALEQPLRDRAAKAKAEDYEP